MDPKIGLVVPEQTELAADELAAVEKLQKAYHDLRSELGKVIVGQETVIEELLIAMFCRGHALLVGVPGLAKTLLISTLAKTLGLSFNRIQFTPDLMPSDITGTEVIEEDKTTGSRGLRFVRGPIFANVILADEINRTPPKNPSSPSGSDAGTSGHCRGKITPFASTVFCSRNTEPDRTGRHISVT